MALTHFTTKCVICDKLLYVNSYEIKYSDDISWVMHNTKPKTKSYFHMDCYRRLTRGYKHESTAR